MGRRTWGSCAAAVALMGVAEPALGAWTMHPPKAPPPGQSQSCVQPEAPPADFTTDCENCRDLELVSCDIFLGDDEQGNKITFTVKNHNTKFPRRSDSARFGHVGIGPGGGAAAPTGTATNKSWPGAELRAKLMEAGTTNAPPGTGSVTITETSTATSISTDPLTYDAAPPVSLSVPSADTPKFKGELDQYPSGPPPAVYSEAMPDSFTVAPQETKTFEVDAITDFPVIAQCQDIVYLAVNQYGILETPYLWNRNYACTVKPCYELGFRQCKMHRGGGTKSAAIPMSAPAKP